MVTYVSTRGGDSGRTFSEILLEGLAPDGGLYVPETYPQITPSTLESWRALSYAELAYEVLTRFAPEIPEADLRSLVASTYTSATFGTEEITPLVALDADVSLLELSNGPTLAFKDIALQLLGALFEYRLRELGQSLNIVGATSGDTGSAAEYAMRGRTGIAVFMLSPHGRMSEFQQAQMFTLTDANIHNLSVRGVFDDCQDLVKEVSADLDFKRRLHIGTVNSINWARLAAQVVYYVRGWLAATADGAASEVSFAVPSGNFGNICAGHVARMMGVPIRRLVVATNENNVLEEFFRTGHYRVRTAADTQATSSPSMDISKASNFERFIFDVVGRDSERMRSLFGEQVPRGGFTMTGADYASLADFGFVAGRSSHADRLATIKAVHDESGRLIDTHTADGVRVARDQVEPGVPMVVVETAQPVKFADVVHEATGVWPPVPDAISDLRERPRRFEVIDPDLAALRAYVEQHAV